MPQVALGARWTHGDLGDGSENLQISCNTADNTSKIKLKLQDIQDAHVRIKDSISMTPLIEANYIENKFCNTFLKCENLQTTGSYKARGACNILSTMTAADKSRGITVAGGRNFLQAMTHYGLLQSVPINVVVPKHCPLVDKQRYKEDFALIKVHGNDNNDAVLHAITHSEMIGSNYVYGSDRLDLLAGYGTVGLEILNQLEKVDAIICPVGSGSLIAGLIVAVKTLKPSCLIYGVETMAAPTMTRALQEKKPVMIQMKPTIADSLSSIIVGSNTYHIVRGYLDKMITMDETWICRAMSCLYEREKLVVEGAAACAVAALMAGKVPELRAKNVVCLVTGGNISLPRLAGAVERGLAAEGRLVRFTTSLPDAAGALQRLLARVTECGAEVKTIEPEHSWMRQDVFTFSEPDISAEPHILTFNEIKQAAERIEGSIVHTPLCEAKLSKHMDYDVYLKCENLQYTGSCAERGVRNALLAYGKEGRERGMIVPSRGNMALAAAYHGNSLQVPVTVVLPERAAPVLAQRCSELGADVVMCGDSHEDTIAYSCKAREQSGQILLSGDDPLVLGGLGTVGLEILSQLPETDAVLVPTAAGGLLAAVLVACKKIKCSCLVYGAECAKVPKMMKALQAGQPVKVQVYPNLADGLNTSIVGTNAFATIKGRLDRMLIVEESAIARASIAMLERERLVADGAGVCALAALMQGLVPELRGKRAVCIISGGNIDAGRLCRVVQRGLGATGRLLRFAVAIPDERCGLQNLAKVIADESGVLKSIVTEQIWVHSDTGTTWANVVVETANEEHTSNIKDHLRSKYPSVRFAVIDLDDKHKVSI